jgi:hypothetical protein
MSTPGNTNNPNGRPAGKGNIRSRQIAEEAEQENASPPRLLIKIISGEKIEICGEPVTKDDWKWAISELLPYVAGKRKPVDSEGNDKSDVIATILEAIDAHQ